MMEQGRMGRPAQDLTGRRFGKLVAQHSPIPEPGKKRKWVCVCDCGRTSTPFAGMLLQGKTRGCGCGNAESKTTHGLSGHPLYVVWKSMSDRCTNPNAMYFSRYGGRGIKVCDRWKAFEAFYEDVIKGYAAGLEIDRIDNDGDYEPGNVRWSTSKENNRNRSNNVVVEWQGERVTLAELAERYEVPYLRLWKRYRTFGWPIERALLIEKLTPATQRYAHALPMSLAGGAR